MEAIFDLPAKADSPTALTIGKFDGVHLGHRAVIEHASMSPEAFAFDVLVGRLGVQSLLIGEDFRFGAGRAGDVATIGETRLPSIAGRPFRAASRRRSPHGADADASERGARTGPRRMASRATGTCVAAPPARD